jgi:hypothetical protein
LLLFFLLPKQDMAQKTGIAVSETNNILSFPILKRTCFC